MMDKKILRAIREDALNGEAFRVSVLGRPERTKEEFERELKARINCYETRINCCGKTNYGMSYSNLCLAKILNKAVHTKKEFCKAVNKAKKGDVILWHDINKKQAGNKKWVKSNGKK